MYRDSKHGLTIDLSGINGNVYVLWAHANHLDRQLGNDPTTFRQHLDLAYAYCVEHDLDFSGYALSVAIFEHRYPMVRVINKPEKCLEHGAENSRATST